MKNYVFPETIDGTAIRDLRHRLSMTQRELAVFLRVSVKTVERWESGKEPITGPIIPLVRILREDERIPDRYLIPERRFPLRLWYYFRDDVCTIIDVETDKQRVEIYNYTDHIQFRAFGVVEHPTWKQYEQFLESRCFPRTRDKIKIELRALDLPFYDPLMIIEKTEGRMADDEFRIRVER